MDVQKKKTGLEILIILIFRRYLFYAEKSCTIQTSNSEDTFLDSVIQPSSVCTPPRIITVITSSLQHSDFCTANPFSVSRAPERR